ncbi:Gfo/Idh/MocA family oxidoreductase [Nocardiopsis sp. CNT-189]|uniref:Gfo/Idh/MocA family protein n=1 Tax=Nocardiopsis oceanisediminis TaxID=2816862 RepID=UPI003B2C73E2
METTDRLLLVGAGARVREVLLPALDKAGLPLRITGVADPDPGAAGRLRRGALTAYPSLEKALAADAFDIAILACPHHLHYEAAQRLRAAGLTVWKEKPLALTLTEAERLAARGRVRVLAHRPHGQLYAIARRLLAGWGRLLSYRIRITRPTGDYSATWRASHEHAGGGALLDLGYHAFDLIARFTEAEATGVYALTGASPAWRAPVEVEETAHVLLTHRGSTTGSVYVSRCDERADVLDLVAEGGRITIIGDRARVCVGDRGGPLHVVALEATEDPWARMLAHHFATRHEAAVDTGEARVGIAATALMEAAYASLASGRPEPLPNAPLKRSA